MAWSSYILIRTQNLGTTYTMTLRWKFEYFPRSFLGMLYIILKFEKVEIQHFKQCINRSWNKEDMDDKENYAKKNQRSVSVV